MLLELRVGSEWLGPTLLTYVCDPSRPFRAQRVWLMVHEAQAAGKDQEKVDRLKEIARRGPRLGAPKPPTWVRVRARVGLGVG